MGRGQDWARKDLAGLRFGRLTVLAPAGSAPNRKVMWSCRCDCGGTRVTEGSDLRRGRTLSCGCVQRERTLDTHTKHGHAPRIGRSPEYTTWKAMISRCHDSSTPSFKWYGARGISVCPEWLNSFETFLADMGQRPTAKHSIERMNNDLGYSKSNCMWATSYQQVRNRRGVRCVVRDDGTQYLTIKDAATANGVSAYSISSVCQGTKSTSAGHSWRFASQGETALLRALISQKEGVE